MSRKTILVVDDDVTMRSILEIALQDVGGFKVTLTDSGPAGLEAVDQNVDLVLLDSQMPILSGAEVLKRLKASPDTRDVPVILLTADSNEEVHREMIERGALTVLTKPVNPLTIADQIKRLLSWA